jgi:phosphoglycerol transferase MdoB-like AlkP superfamily enzyme
LPKRSIIFLILGLTLHECGIASTTLYFDLTIPMSIFWSYGLLLFLAVLMLKFTQPILLGSHYIQPNSVTRRYTLIHGAILAFLTIICTANVAVWGYYYDHHDRSYYADYSALVTSGFKLSIAYHALFMLVALYTAVFLYFCLRKSKTHQYDPSSTSSSSSSSSALSFSSLLPIIPATLAASNLVALASRAYYYDLWNYDGSSTLGARVVLDVLENLLPVVAFAMAIWVVGKAREVGGAAGGGVPAGPYEQGQGWHGQPEYVQPQGGFAQPQEHYGMGQYGNGYAPGKP